MELYLVLKINRIDGIVYDVSCPSSFENLSTWLNECEAYSTDKAENIVKLLVANKIDLVCANPHRVGQLSLERSRCEREGWSRLRQTACRILINS